MPKTSYTPTEADRLTGENVRQLRRRAGETLAETLERSGLDLGQSSLSRIELGQRPLSTPEATKLAAHWNTTVDRIFIETPEQHAERNAWKWRGTPEVETEQQFLGNEKPALFSVPQQQADELDRAFGAVKRSPLDSITIYRDNPMTPEQYRAEVWVPYLEARYATEQKAS